MLPLVAGPEEQRHHDREADRRSDAARCGREPAGHHAEPALLRDGLLHAARKRVAKARERHGRARAAPFDDGLVDADSREQHARNDVARQDTGRRERRFVNEDLSHGAEDAAAEKGVEIVHQLSSPMFSRMTAWHTPGMLSPCMVEVGESSAPVGAKMILFHLPSRIPRRR